MVTSLPLKHSVFPSCLQKRPQIPHTGNFVWPRPCLTPIIFIIIRTICSSQKEWLALRLATHQLTHHIGSCGSLLLAPCTAVLTLLLPNQCSPGEKSIPSPGFPRPLTHHSQTLDSYFCSCSRHCGRCWGLEIQE